MVHLGQCPSCGSREFTLQELYYLGGDVDAPLARLYDKEVAACRVRIECEDCFRFLEGDDFVAVDFV